jgi:hypothetical protein
MSKRENLKVMIGEEEMKELRPIQMLLETKISKAKIKVIIKIYSFR